MTITIPIELIGGLVGVAIFLFGAIVGYSMGKDEAEMEVDVNKLKEAIELADRRIK